MPNGPTSLFSHGDRVGAPWHYQCYRKIVRSSLVRLIATCLPQSYLEKLALRISKESRERGRYAPNHHKAIVGKLTEWASPFNVDYAIVGHFHAPYQVRCATANTTLLCLESWDTPNFLAYDTDRFYRVYIKNPGQTFKAIALNV